jgi:hypothetical protein
MTFNIVRFVGMNTTALSVSIIRAQEHNWPLYFTEESGA